MTSNVKGEGLGNIKGQYIIFVHNFCSICLQTSNLSHIVAYEKGNKFLTSNVKGEGQGHVKSQNNIFGHKFGFTFRADLQLVSYCSLWKGK